MSQYDIISRLPIEVMMDIIASLKWDDIARLCAASKNFRTFCSTKDGLRYILIVKGYSRTDLQHHSLSSLKLMVKRADWKFTYKGIDDVEQDFTIEEFPGANLVDVDNDRFYDEETVILDNNGKVQLSVSLIRHLKNEEFRQYAIETELNNFEFLPELSSHYISQVAYGIDYVLFLDSNGTLYGIAADVESGYIPIGIKRKKSGRLIKLIKGVKSIATNEQNSFLVTLEGNVLVCGYTDNSLGMGNSLSRNNRENFIPLPGS